MSKTIEFDEECQSCGGTGLYIGFAEHDGAAVVCHTCNGTGCHHFSHVYQEFIKRKHKRGAIHVVQANPGIGIGTFGKGVAYALSDFGGMSYKDWLAGKPFTQGMEMRQFTCPAWWYQSVDYKKKPDWDECSRNLGRTFSQCDQFKWKDECWKRFDRENVRDQEGERK